MIIAIKGLIGSGKSTISKTLETEHGFHIINCDKIVHELYESNEQLKKEVCEKFDLKELDRKELGAIVFNDAYKLEQLEDIVHPILTNTCEEIIKNHENVVIDCQIIDKLDITYDVGIIATAEIETIVERVKARDGRSEEEILKIVNLQQKNHLLRARTYAVTTEEDYHETLEKIIRSYNDSKNWKDC